MQIEWNLHMLRGVIDDGNPEFHVRDVFDWTITFWSKAVLSLSTERNKTAVPIADNYYRVNAEIIYISRDSRCEFCILDFGIMAISESATLLGIPLPPGCEEGDYVAGEIRLELPLWTEVQPYNIRRRWRVNRITADLANFSLYPGDLGKVDYQDVLGTDSVKSGSYVLHCSALNSLI
jgi:hypothetical protein